MRDGRQVRITGGENIADVTADLDLQTKDRELTDTSDKAGNRRYISVSDISEVFGEILTELKIIRMTLNSAYDSDFKEIDTIGE